jgi:hypothetical protein
MSKYAPLAEYCRQQTLQTFDLPFHKIEAILGFELPTSALRPRFWANTVDGGSPVRKVMRDTPYETFLIDGSRRVQFRRK